MSSDDEYDINGRLIKKQPGSNINKQEMNNFDANIKENYQDIFKNNIKFINDNRKGQSDHSINTA